MGGAALGNSTNSTAHMAVSFHSLDQETRDILKDILSKCLRQFTVQHNDLFDYVFDYLIARDKAVTALYQFQPQLIFMADALCETFKFYVLPLLITTTKRNLLTSPTFVNSIHTQLNIRLFDKLTDASLGLDIEFINALSGESYESSSTKSLAIVLLSSTDDLNKCKSAVPFSGHSLSHQNIRVIRKQLNMAENSALAIAKDISTGEFYTVGLMPIKDALKHPRIHFINKFDWCFCVPTASTFSSFLDKNRTELKKVIERDCRIRFHGNVYKFPLINPERRILENMTRIFSSNTTAKVPTQITKGTNKCQHGAVLIFGDKDFIQAETQRCVDEGLCGIRFSVPHKLINGNKISPILYQFASIDGALLVDLDGYCHACGVILDGRRVSAGDPARGARFNSTKVYTETILDYYKEKGITFNYPIASIVKSEDGMLDIFPPA